MLRSQRKSWEMVFVRSGVAALEEMKQVPFDVVVTDMKMPSMNGAELLSRVKLKHPDTVRIVLSGHAELEAVMQTVSVSHQFLSKPCDSESLKRAVIRACALKSMLENAGFRKALGTIDDLPVLPRIYNALNSALAEEEVDLNKISSIVEQDIGIAAKILQLVNSSFFGVRTEINDLRQATSFLGVSTIRDLVLSFKMFQQFSKTQQVEGFSIEREQAHSLLTARIARRLFKQKEASEEAFLAAMLHDIGKLVFMAKLPKQMGKSIQAGAGVERSFYLVEEELYGISHAEIGAYLLGLWGMPYPVVEAVAYHHHPARILNQPSFGTLGATHVADALAHELTDAGPGAPQLDEEYLSSLGVLHLLPQWREIAMEEASAKGEAA